LRAQSRLLSLLRVLGKGNAKASEAMNDVLAQVATHTDASRTAGNAILYDAVQCILGENESWASWHATGAGAGAGRTQRDRDV
jgi:hypothetical protein